MPQNADIEHALNDLRESLVHCQIVGTRWMIAAEIIYFAGLCFVLAHHCKS